MPHFRMLGAVLVTVFSSCQQGKARLVECTKVLYTSFGSVVYIVPAVYCVFDVQVAHNVALVHRYLLDHISFVFIALLASGRGPFSFVLSPQGEGV